MRQRGERGQATVEFALIVPIVLLFGLMLIQVAVVVSAQVAVTHTAREVARALAVDPAADIGQVTRNSTTLGTNSLVVSVQFDPSDQPGREIVSVTISYETMPIIGLFKPVSGAFHVQAKAKMMVET